MVNSFLSSIGILLDSLGPKEALINAAMRSFAA